MATEAEKQTFSGFTRRVLVVLALVVLAVLLWKVTYVLLLLFLGVLLSTFLVKLSATLSAHTPLSKSVSLAVVTVGVLVFVGGGGWLLESRIAQQIGQLQQQVQQSIKQLQQYSWGQQIIKQAPSIDQLIGGGPGIFSQITGVASQIFDILTGFLIVVSLGAYLASNPGLYERGIVQLFPEKQRARIQEALDITGRALWWWLLTQFVSMTIIGILTWLGLMLLGMPLALTLGVIAGLFEFIPLVGPFIGAIPAVLVAFTQGVNQVLYVLLLYVGIQQIESYLVMPIVQRYGTTLPPVLTLLAAVTFGLLFGALGIVVATPLMLTVYVLVKLLYVEDVLGSSTNVPGREHQPS